MLKFKKILLIALFLIASIAYRTLNFAETESTDVNVESEISTTAETESKEELSTTIETNVSKEEATETLIESSKFDSEDVNTEVAETENIEKENATEIDKNEDETLSEIKDEVDVNAGTIIEEDLDEGIMPANINPLSKQFSFSTNLNQFIENVEVEGLLQDGEGNYVVVPYTEYAIDVAFKETETMQFDMDDTDKEFVYTLPSGLEGINSQQTNFTINIIDQNGPASISGNHFILENGKIKVHFNINDPNYSRLKLLPNVAFVLSIKAKFDGTTTQIDLGNNVVIKLKYENNASLEIKKTGAQRNSSKIVDYTLTIKSNGINENVKIEDFISGTALTLNKNLYIESSIKGELHPSIVYNETSGENKGFSTVIDRMINGEVVTIKYTSTIDFNKITDIGTVNQTSNRATAESNQTPLVEANHHLFKSISYKGVTKKAATPVTDPNNPNLHKLSWEINVNEEKIFDMSNRVIVDEIHSTSVNVMHIVGTGIKMEVTKPDGSIEIRNLTWSDLTVTRDGSGRITAWKYNVPSTDGISTYKITVDTEVDSSNVFARLVVLNKAKIEGVKDITASQVFGLVVGENSLTAKKEAVSVNSQEIEWKITVDVASRGYPSFYIVDDVTRILYKGVTYKDEFIPSTLVVEGLYPEETYKLNENFSGDSNTFSLVFYQNQEKTIEGLKPSTNNKKRSIVITYKSKVNQDILAIAHANGYSDYTAEHRNNISARVTAGDYVGAVAKAYPKIQSIEKKYLSMAQDNINGIHYPVFNYSIVISNVSGDPETIMDKFDINYLKYYDANGIVIKGGLTAEEQTVVGGNATVEATAEGIKININDFPKNAGKLYPFYKIEYSLIVKDEAALNALNAIAINEPEGHVLTNTASWNGLQSESVDAKYTHYPYVDKKLELNPSSANDYIAEFSIVVNKYATDLMPNSNVLSITDTLSDNLRFIPESVVYDPAVNATYNYENNVLTFNDLPDNQKITIKYKAKVLGKGIVKFTNTAKFSNFESKIVNNVNITYTGTGTGSNPSITLYKVDDIDNTKPIQGAVFQLFYVNDVGVDVAVKDKNDRNVTFTTGADGKVLIVGDSVNLGWALWSDGRTYKLKEIARPSWYLEKGEYVTFKFKDIPLTPEEYSVVGETLLVKNSRVKTTVTATKTWVNGPIGDHGQVSMELTRSSVTVPKEVVNVAPDITGTGPYTYTWNNLPKTDTQGNDYIYEVEEQGVVNGIYTAASGNSYTVTQVGNNITNTYQAAMTSFTATKVWENGPTNRPTIMLQLKQNGAPFGQPVALASGTTSHTWTNLPKSDQQGVDYVYSVDEVTVPTNYVKEVINNTTIKNSYVAPKTEVTATKVWVNGPATDHVVDAIEIELYRNIAGQPEQLVNVAPVPFGTGPFTYTWSHLEKTDIQGNEYIYTVKEKGVVNHEVVVNGNTYVVSQVGNTITNTYRSEEISFTGTKVWEQGPTVRPNIQLQLKQNGVSYLAPVTLANGTTSHTWTNLPKSDNQGVDYVYSIDEVVVPANYRKTIIDEQTIKNTYHPVVVPPSGGTDEEIEEVVVHSQKWKVPKTGDSTNTTLYVVFALAASAGLVYVFIKRKKKE